MAGAVRSQRSGLLPRAHRSGGSGAHPPGQRGLHGEKAQETEVVVDTTVQEKNITHPTDTKLAHKIIRRCWKLADRHGLKLRRRYRKAVRQHVMAQRWRRDPQKRPVAQRGCGK